jgi:hypothetical protein
MVKASTIGLHPNMMQLSHSSQTLLELCPKKFQLDRLMRQERKAGESVDLDFGTTLGNMVQDYLVTGDENIALWNGFRTYPRELFQDRELASKSGNLGTLGNDINKEFLSKKNFWYAAIALDKFKLLRDTELNNWYVPTLNGKPAIELGFKIDCENGFTYRGKLDAFLVHKTTGNFAVFENKTTGSKWLSEAAFQNSGQGIGYSTIVDAIAKQLGLVIKNNFPVFYTIYMTTKQEWVCMRFTKSKSTHANWLRKLLLSIKHISEYAEEDFFPQQGQNCTAFGRPCQYFELCDMKTQLLAGKTAEVREDNPEDYPYTFTLSEVINAQLEKINSGE